MFRSLNSHPKIRKVMEMKSDESDRCRQRRNVQHNVCMEECNKLLTVDLLQH